MSIGTIVIGALITLTGTGAFIGSGDLLALVPGGMGVVLVVLGWLGIAEQRQAIMGHAAVLLTFVGMVFSASTVVRLLHVIAGDQVERPGAVVAISCAGLLCLVHVTMSIRWFLARKRSASA